MGLTSPINDVTLVWDEINDLDLDRYEVWRAPFLPIAGANPGLKQFAITRMLASWFTIGDTVQVTGSTGNDGNYTIDTITEAAGITTIQVIEAIPSAVADGHIGNVLLDQLAAETSKGYYKDRDMPVGFYYYAVYSVDKQENYSDPTNVIQKFSPMDITPPATPTGLRARRNSKYTAVELSWNEVEQYDLKGYIIRRTLNPYAGTPTWETIGFTSSNKFTDSEIPINNDATYKRTDASYYLEAYDKYGNVSAATAATVIFEIPAIRGVRVSLDYLNLNIYWDEPLPEDGIAAVAVLLRLKGSSVWTFMGVSEWPKNFFRIGTDLTPNTDYEIAVAVVKSGVHTIIEAVGVSDRLFILGDYEAEFPTGDYIAIYDSSNQDGQWEISNSNYSSPKTQLDIVENLPVEYTVNGIDLARNTIQISGDSVADFTDKYVILTVFGSTGNDGSYRVLSAELYQGQTRLYVQEPIPSAVVDGEATTGKLINLTELLDTIQTPIQLVPIPDYDTDTTEPTSPELLTAVMDPENRRTFLNWSKIAAEDDFLEFHVEINILGGDFPITLADQASDFFKITGDQTAYFIIGQQIRVYGSTGNDGWYYVTNVVLNAGNTEIYIDGQVSSSVADGKIVSDYAWILLDKTKNTNFQAYFPYSYNLATPNEYWFRVRAVDRSGNKNLPELCLADITWLNPDLLPNKYTTSPFNIIPTSTNLFVPQWIDYTEQFYSTYKGTLMRRYVLTTNNGPAYSKYFKQFVMLVAEGPWSATPWSYFNFTLDEIINMQDRNVFTYETVQSPAHAITGANPGTKSFAVAGDQTGLFVPGYVFSVYRSTGNDGTYTTVNSIHLLGTTTITVLQAIPSAVADGNTGRSIWIWPAIEDIFKQLWLGPTSSIREIWPTP